ncbi:hypothetical protein FEM48_Zijuj06G0090700 [Ziziphus jujuba var. spinosa]|uniref:Uncharacterized protein n=1 Tax=Ziziphus jujuba var. spinosa TaxID=714518 RepID=A0A978V8D5_ZIZJJ|nr:hypothetical protein FEM48_Zijuj06G0090700 [Ziziphus jujuba var. spinosa]
MKLMRAYLSSGVQADERFWSCSVNGLMIILKITSPPKAMVFEWLVRLWAWIKMAKLIGSQCAAIRDIEDEKNIEFDIPKSSRSLLTDLFSIFCWKLFF